MHDSDRRGWVCICIRLNNVARSNLRKNTQEHCEFHFHLWCRPWTLYMCMYMYMYMCVCVRVLGNKLCAMRVYVLLCVYADVAFLGTRDCSGVGWCIRICSRNSTFSCLRFFLYFVSMCVVRKGFRMREQMSYACAREVSLCHGRCSPIVDVIRFSYDRTRF